jgi:glycosyltransferase involved in cell wall biosynthesis
VSRRWTIARAARYGRALSRWGRLALHPQAGDDVRVFYGWDLVPGEGEPVAGGTVKIQLLASRFPNRPTDFSVLYLGSSYLPRDLRPLMWASKRRGAAVVVNQNGVGYPGWAGDRTEAVNRPQRRAIRGADHVLYQSAFAKDSADIFLGEPRGEWEILHNAVDVARFTPGEPPSGAPTLLLGGDQTQAYRLDVGLRTLAAVRRSQPDASLIVSGRLVSDPEPLIRELGLAGAVEFVGRYAQRDAPDVYRRAHVLLHPKVNDPCPSTVLEAMATGVPVVYAASGGTIELVGNDAGIGVRHPVSWERDEPPDPEALADAVGRVLDAHDSYAGAARRRAVERFSLEPWLDRHEQLFAQLLART